MKNNTFNRKELQIINMINQAKAWISCGCELEIDLFNGGWYCMEYNAKRGEAIPMDYYIYKLPIITDQEADDWHVDMHKIFDYCKVAYCG